VIKNENYPIGGKDYPRTLQEFDDWFSTEEKCLEFLKRLRWNEGFLCPECGNNTGWQKKAGLI